MHIYQSKFHEVLPLNYWSRVNNRSFGGHTGKIISVSDFRERSRNNLDVNKLYQKLVIIMPNEMLGSSRKSSNLMQQNVTMLLIMKSSYVPSQMKLKKVLGIFFFRAV